MKVRKYKCETCEQCFTASHSLKNHLKSKHELVSYNCEQCDYKVSYKTRLNLHVKTIHEGKRYPCDYCDWKGLSSVDLRSHIRKLHGEDTLTKFNLKLEITSTNLCILSCEGKRPCNTLLHTLLHTIVQKKFF